MRLILAGIALFFVPVAALQAQANNPALKKTLETRYSQFSRGFQTKNIKPIAALFAPDFMLKQVNGQKVHLVQLLSSVQRQIAVAHSIEWSRKIKGLTTAGNQAVATVDGRFAGKVNGSDGKDHQLILLLAAKDTWVKTSGGWKLKSTEMLKSSLTRDGKPVPAPGNPEKK
jgi:hypothetical protein